MQIPSRICILLWEIINLIHEIRRLHRSNIIWCSLLNYAVHWTLPHSFRNLKIPFWNFDTSEYLRMYPYLNVFGWIFIHVLLFYFDSGLLPKILLISSVKCLNSSMKFIYICKFYKLPFVSNIWHLWEAILISPFRKYKVGCFRVDNTLLFFFAGMWQSSPWMNLLLSVVKSPSFYTISLEKNLIVISHSRNLNTDQLWIRIFVSKVCVHNLHL